MKTLSLKNEFERIWTKIEKGDNFALTRYGDGERAFIIGKSVQAQEGWVSPEFVSKLGNDLLQTLEVEDEKFIYGISCPCCDSSAFYWYSTRLKKNAPVTFANIFVNSNYKRFRSKISKLKRDAVFIGNHNAYGKAIGNLNILDYFLVDNDCTKFWENNSSKLLDAVKNKYSNAQNLLFVVAAGPMSEPIIYELFKNNPNNTYIDFGSALDEFIHGKKTRPYQDFKSKFARKKCKMPDLNLEKISVSAVLTLYKRPKKLLEQISALENQTLKPSEIIVFHDYADDTVKLPEEARLKLSNYIKTDRNVGVWGRFAGGLLSGGKYVCFFDDDTIPASRWLENCHSQMLEKEALYGTIGIRALNLRNYPYKDFERLGWDGFCNSSKKVDFVGHSWFLKKDWLGAMWINNSEFFELKYVAEDAFLSYSLKKWLNIDTYVAPHPAYNPELFGSIPQKAWEYGQEKGAAISMDEKMCQRMNKALNMLADMGMKPVMSRTELYFRKCYRRFKKIWRK